MRKKERKNKLIDFWQGFKEVCSFVMENGFEISIMLWLIAFCLIGIFSPGSLLELLE